MAESKMQKMEKLQLEMEQVSRTKSLLNQNQVQKLFNSTPQKFKYDRPGKGGSKFTYVKASYVRKVLDAVFGFNWSFEIETTLEEAFEIANKTNYCVVKGILIGRVYQDKEWIELKKTQFGRAEVKWQMEGQGDNRKKKLDKVTGAPMPLDFGNDMKAASSDALKKCASLFGIAADVYEADEFIEIEIVGSDENSDRSKATKKKVADAKKVLESGSEKVGKENE